MMPPTLDGRRSEIHKFKDQTSRTFYEHVEFLWRCLRRYDKDDIVALTLATLRKMGSDTYAGTDFLTECFESKGMLTRRNTLIHTEHEKIAKHLTNVVYTDDHFCRNNTEIG